MPEKEISRPASGSPDCLVFSAHLLVFSRAGSGRGLVKTAYAAPYCAAVCITLFPDDDGCSDSEAPTHYC